MNILCPSRKISRRKIIEHVESLIVLLDWMDVRKMKWNTSSTRTSNYQNH